MSYVVLTFRAAALVIVLGMVPACGPLGGAIGNLKKALVAPSPSGAQPTSHALTPVPTWVVCLDWTGSYPASSRRQAQDQLAGDLNELAYPGSPGAIVWIRKIVANSFGPASELFKFSVAAIPAMPRHPSRNTHPLNWPSVKRAYSRARGSVIARLRSARANLAMDASRVQALRSHVAHSSDIWGCVSAASQLLTQEHGLRTLIIVTDGRAWGGQQKLRQVDLKGVRVIFAYFLCSRAASCSHVMAIWAHALATDGAASVRFLRPETTYSFFRSPLPDPP
jgi:hypothetical protein